MEGKQTSEMIKSSTQDHAQKIMATKEQREKWRKTKGNRNTKKTKVNFFLQKILP